MQLQGRNNLAVGGRRESTRRWRAEAFAQCCDQRALELPFMSTMWQPLGYRRAMAALPSENHLMLSILFFCTIAMDIRKIAYRWCLWLSRRSLADVRIRIYSWSTLK